ncbi:soma ferritin-like [Diaphorina citri]|uniref:Ferritin n=1 Tax=Diaphorina citri TaxID=121845 RepID=A0A1S3DFX4_DIACI|nr:soma ferritin-like [Diaphorina citri]
MAVSQVRQNFHAETEEKINKQINLELYASYVYLSMSAHFDRDVVALPGISKYFKHASDEESEHAHKLIKYLNKRGGTLKLVDVKAPARQEWGTTEEAFSHALQLEKDVNQVIIYFFTSLARCVHT